MVQLSQSRNNRLLTTLVGLCVVAALATASAFADTQPRTVTSNDTFLMNGQPFFPVMGQVRKCPNKPDPANSSVSIADDMVSLNVNILFGMAGTCGLDDATAVQNLHASLSDRMGWLEDQRGGRPLPNLSQLLPEFVNWQGGPEFVTSPGALIGCTSHSSISLYNDSVAAAKRGPAVAFIQIGAPDGDSGRICVTPERIKCLFWTAVVGHAKGIWWVTIDPLDASSTDFSVPAENRTAAIQLMQQLSTLRRVILGNDLVRIAVSSGPVRASAWSYRGREYIVAVNTIDKSVPVTIQGLGTKKMVTLGGNKPVKTSGGAFSQKFQPLEVRFYRSI